LSVNKPKSKLFYGAAATEGIVDKTIARLNIEHYRRQLVDEKDEIKRRMLQKLLAEEEEKLAMLAKGQQERRKL
jgi:hypothetical protein